jgi:L-threonylcarbamoyladenylate synthase
VSPELTARVAEVALLLRGGGVVVYPTETFYGLGALVTHPEALRRLAGAKLRADRKPLPLIAGDLAQVESVASLAAPLARALAGSFWPGALTLVLPATSGVDPHVRGSDGTVAIRIPGSELARALALAAGAPLVSTSANLAGEPPPASPGELSAALLARLDGVLDAGPTPGGLPSTIVAVSGDTVRLLRAGAVPWTQVEAVAGR